LQKSISLLQLSPCVMRDKDIKIKSDERKNS